MEERFQNSPGEVKTMSTEQLKEAFAITNLMQNDKLHFIYSHYDRMITGGTVPVNETISLGSYDQLKSEYFLQRREMGIINVGASGKIVADGINYDLDNLDCLYLGVGIKNVNFLSSSSESPAKFFILSSPGHQTHPNSLMKNSDAVIAKMGSPETSNERTIFKYIHPDGIKSCQLVMGLTILKNGSVWNTMPAHTHNRRMEVYFYFNLNEEQSVFHFMGEPQQTRHVILQNHEAIISPPWSIHSGCGTASYSFIWGMAGENQSFADMDFIQIKDLK
jgi:4-deoxy-L-threo-5-hexosulose-uronate ketol-isomerase